MGPASACRGQIAGQSTGESYPSYTECLGACTSLAILHPPSATNPSINMNIVSGDSFECRRRFAFQANVDLAGGTAAASYVALHDCLIAGNFGGDVVGQPGVCGNACDFYCDEMNGNPNAAVPVPGHCSVAQGGYPDYPTCVSTCTTQLNKNRATLNEITTGDISAMNNLECRVVWAGLAQNTTIAAYACAAASPASVVGACAAPVVSSTATHHSSSTGLSAATNLQVSLVGLLACVIAALALMRR